MADHDLDRLIHDYYKAQDAGHASERLAERIESIPDLEPDSSSTPHGWRQRLGRWLGRDAGDVRSADVHGRSGPTKDGRRRMMTTTAAATAVVALTLGLSLGPLGLLQTTQEPASPENGSVASVALPDAAMRGGPVTVNVCHLGIVDEGTELPGLDHTLGRTETSRWESSGSLYGEDEPRLAGIATRVTNWSYGTFDDLRDIEFEQHAFNVENDGGSWQGESTTFVRGRDPGRSTEVLVLEGQDGYAGLTAMLQFPIIDAEMGTYPDCYELFGVIVESDRLPAPQPVAGDPAVAGAVQHPIGTVFTDDGFLPFEETGFALAPGTWNVELMNMSETARAFVIEDPSGTIVAGSPVELVEPGGMSSYEIVVEGSGDGYAVYDPADRAGTEMAIPAQE